MKRLRADGYYLLHNHPSGNPTASKEDVKLTKVFSDGVSGYKGHVIINSNKYGIINLLEDHADVAVLDLKQQRLDLALRPTIQNDLLSVHIDNAEKAAEIVKALQLNNDKSIIVFADVKGNTRGIQEVPNGMIKNLDSFKGYLRNQGVYFGSGWAFLATSSNDIYRNTEKLIKEKYLMDAIFTDSDDVTTSSRKSGISQSEDYEWAGIKSGDIGAKRVNESVNKYSLKDMVMIDEKAAYTKEKMDLLFNRYGSRHDSKYSKAYVAYVSPDDFLSVTSTNLAGIEADSRELDINELRNERQEIILQFDPMPANEEVTGHEGRHKRGSRWSN